MSKTKSASGTISVVCPYCSAQAKLMDSGRFYSGKSYGNVWACVDCWAWVGVHKGKFLGKKNVPLGTLADKKTRWWRAVAHDKFDRLWTLGIMSRGDAYDYMARIMNIPPEQAHIGMFTAMQCRELVEKISRDLNP